uniref:Uncharacterized protein n=1 Tax=Entomoneis paludosa TaxID=265537 RepID=A0A7S2YEL5_9STRA|mmetsp:Transcript_29760/g.62190  ORF Transcript_29760/g.62190 Transcript_29760/m.62190 type:complete len:123 (+) Transcript_29760:128-496(+)|eukprot:CAMPEP_0172444836 /NCGR_PEP_ID=MMETSP1065-20121228/4828_1 /TAXON_ID=265537 /ORGANISM="Amphiprora paludosa, Strain CCMP125" /LENGTH=122 /DNA_ID=CAMNT_0013195539 /DNA_START=150 /DNA_END=518 /DNA_ORIENTATION=+
MSTAAAASQVKRTTPELYRDCLRLIRHVAPGTSSGKAVALRTMVRGEFKKPLTAGQDVESRKAQAIRALSNYMLTVAAPKDEKLKSSMKDFHGRSVQEAKDLQKSNQQEKEENVQQGDSKQK